MRSQYPRSRRGEAGCALCQVTTGARTAELRGSAADRSQDLRVGSPQAASREEAGRQRLIILNPRAGVP